MQEFSAIFIFHKLLYIICFRKESRGGVTIILSMFKMLFTKFSLFDLMMAATLGISNYL